MAYSFIPSASAFSNPVKPREKKPAPTGAFSALMGKVGNFFAPKPIERPPASPGLFSDKSGVGLGDMRTMSIGGMQIPFPTASKPATPPPAPVMSPGAGKDLYSKTTPAAPATFENQAIPQVKAQATATPPIPAIPTTPTGLTEQQAIELATKSAQGAPQTPGTPVVPPATTTAIQSAETALSDAMRVTPAELATQEDLDKLIESTKSAYRNIENQPIPLEFITGQLKATEDRALGLAEPLERKLARMQAARTSSIEASKFALDRADKKADVSKSGYTLSPGETRYDAAGNVVATGAAKPVEKPTSVQEYEYAKLQGYKGTYDQYQNEDANRKAKATAGAGDRVLSVTEAQALGVPYGTTQSQALGLGVSGKPTAEQSKARQFAVSADNANKVLDTLGYDPGVIELPAPNVFKSSERQQFEQAARAFVNATLRRESGATITDAEFKNKYKELIPKAGDADAVKTQKAAARAAAVQSIQEAGGNVPASGDADYQKYLKAIGQ